MTSTGPIERDDDERPAPEPSLVGQRIADKFEVLEILGSGAMGRVYKAKQTDLDRMVAIKVLHGHLGGDARVGRRFHREAKAASRLSHPNSVHILDFGSSGGVLYIVMELLEGEDLQVVIDHDAPFTPARIAAVLVPVLRAVDEAHRAGIVHRDLKPENVIVWTDRSGREHVKVCDFGIAKIIDGEGSSITVDGFVCGTPQYMAPEQARGDTIDHRLDVYAAGIVLYQMLCGVVPFAGDTALGIITRHLTDDPVPPGERKPEWNVPTSLESIALKAMQKAPADRHASAGAMADAIDEAVRALGPDAQLKLDDPGLRKHAVRAARSPSRSETTQKTRSVEGGPVPTDSQIRPAVVPQRSLAPWIGLVLLVAFALGGAYLLGAFDGRSPEPTAVTAPGTEGTPAAEPPAAVVGVEPPAPLPEPTPEATPLEGTPPEPTPPAPTGHDVRPGRERDPVAVTPPPVPPTEVAPPAATPPVPSGSPYELAFAEGRRRFLANDVTGAIESFEEAARLAPGSAETQKQLGRAYMRAGDTTRSIAAYRRYLELAPDAADRAVIEGIIAGHSP